jgi:hypothetical protein
MTRKLDALLRKEPLAETVRAFAEYLPECLPNAQPSPRNQGWPKRNPSFGKKLVPTLHERVHELL